MINPVMFLSLCVFGIQPHQALVQSPNPHQRQNEVNDLFYKRNDYKILTDEQRRNNFVNIEYTALPTNWKKQRVTSN